MVNLMLCRGASLPRLTRLLLTPFYLRVVWWGAVTWGIEARVKQALAGVEVPRGCPAGLLFVPDSVRTAIL